jgi:hypothetical protein
MKFNSTADKTISVFPDGAEGFADLGTPLSSLVFAVLRTRWYSHLSPAPNPLEEAEPMKLFVVAAALTLA